MLVSSLLNNSETMVNITKTDIEKLEKPDVVIENKWQTIESIQLSRTCNDSSEIFDDGKKNELFKIYSKSKARKYGEASI